MMAKEFEGRKIRDKILNELKNKVASQSYRPILAVILIGDDPVSLNYVELKKKIALQIGIRCQLFHYSEASPESEIAAKIGELNQDKSVKGIMIQIPLPVELNRNKLIGLIDPTKDIDGLRYCLRIESRFIPPVVLAIEAALEASSRNLSESTIAIVGRGFLVGEPTYRYLSNQVQKMITADSDTQDLAAVTKHADIIISATGQADLIKPEMIKDGVVLIDAGTSEVGGELKGDIDPAAYEKASFYTPVPGGIGPVTVAYLMKNLVNSNLHGT